MHSHKLTLKLFLSDPSAISEKEIVPLFHSWIQTKALAEHMLIDVADYGHVHHGPGVVLVSDEANVYLDHTGGQVGLLYQRKRSIAGATAFPQRLAEVYRHAKSAAELLESSTGGRAKFRGDLISLKIADRLLAPNNSATFEALRDDLEAFGAGLPGRLSPKHRAVEGQMFEVLFQSPG